MRFVRQSPHKTGPGEKFAFLNQRDIPIGPLLRGAPAVARPKVSGSLHAPRMADVPLQGRTRPPYACHGRLGGTARPAAPRAAIVAWPEPVRYQKFLIAGLGETWSRPRNQYHLMTRFSGLIRIRRPIESPSYRDLTRAHHHRRRRRKPQANKRLLRLDDS